MLLDALEAVCVIYIKKKLLGFVFILHAHNHDSQSQEETTLDCQ